VQITAMTLSGADLRLFGIVGPVQLPVTVAPASDLTITVRMSTSDAELPAAPGADQGSTLLTAALTATHPGGSVQLPVFGFAQKRTSEVVEPSLGQVLTTMGYALNVGKAQTNSNPNRGNPAGAMAFEPGTDEVTAQLFVKAGAGNVTVTPVARFSPPTESPFGWYPTGKPDTRNTVGSMARIPDAQTSDKGRMVYPPLSSPANTGFDPGAGAFGIWVYSGANNANGNYDYSQDALNLPAPSVHRFKAYPLKDAGQVVVNTYLLAAEEAANGDYQDFVFVITNVKPAP